MKRNNAYYILTIVPGSKFREPQHKKVIQKVSKGNVLFSIFVILSASYFVHGILFPKDYNPIKSYIQSSRRGIK